MKKNEIIKKFKLHLVLNFVKKIIKQVSFKKVIQQGESIPTGFGIGWRLWDRQEAVCFPIGINYLIGLARSLYIVIKRGIVFGDIARELSQAYDRGKLDANLEHFSNTLALCDLSKFSEGKKIVLVSVLPSCPPSEIYAIQEFLKSRLPQGVAIWIKRHGECVDIITEKDMNALGWFRDAAEIRKDERQKIWERINSLIKQRST